MRPTKYCAKCGEYVAVEAGTKKLVHIDADGNYIYRAHRPVLEES